MSQNTATAITTWFHDEAEEEAMFEDHAYLWRHMLDAIPEQDFSGRTVLDYGCNRGGFLRTLYHRTPFQRGIGVDVAIHSLAEAQHRSLALPLEFMTPAQLDESSIKIDTAFSHEVVYLLSDLNAHAVSMAKRLVAGGRYYIAIGCHTENPLWPQWRRLIATTSNLPVQDYSLDDYCTALWRAGFDVAMRPFAMNDFIAIKPSNAYFPKAADSLLYHHQTKILIQAHKRNG